MVLTVQPWLVNVYSVFVQVGWGSLLGDLLLKLRSVWQTAKGVVKYAWVICFVSIVVPNKLCALYLLWQLKPCGFSMTWLIFLIHDACSIQVLCSADNKDRLAIRQTGSLWEKQSYLKYHIIFSVQIGHL